MKKLLLSIVAIGIAGMMSGQTKPEILYYKFDGTGTTVPNNASNPPVGTTNGTITGGQSQGGTGLCGGALNGTGGSSGSDYVNTGWNTNLGTGAWTLMFWTDNIPNSTTLFYQFGDPSASSFRCFTNGVAGNGNWMLRGPVTDVPCNGCAPINTPSMTAFVYDPVAGNIKAYHNGTLNNTVAQPALNISGSAFKVGGYSSSTGMANGQLMDEFRMYNRALSGTEIAQVWNGCYPFVTVPNDAGVTAIDSPASFCAGQENVVATIKNFGTNQIDTVTVNWAINGTVQTPVLYTNLLDTANGTGPQAAQVTLGSHVFASGKTDTIAVWTTLPNNITDTVTTNDSTVAYLQPSLSGTFTIGGAGANYPDFTAAVNDLNAFGVCGPVVFNVYDSTYTEQVSIGQINGASSINTISFIGATDTTTLTFAPTGSAANYVVQFDGADYITFDNLRIQNSAITYRRVLDYSNDADWNTVQNCTIEQTQNTTSTSTNYALIYSNGATDSYNSFLDNDLLNGSYGLYWRGSSASALKKGTVVRGNNFEGQYYMGMYLYYGDSATIDHNKLFYSGSYTGTGYGIYAYYQDNEFSITNNMVVGDTTNYGTGIWRYGIRMNNCDGTASKRQLIANNMVSISDSVYTGTIYGIYMNNNGYQDVVHNSVYVAGASTNTRAVYATGGGGGSFQNNILVNMGPGYGFYLNSGFTFLNVDYNSYHVPNGNVGYFSAAQDSLTDWQNASGFDQNGVEVDPMFYSRYDLHTCADTLESAGTPTGLVTMDIDMETRGTMPDIGADEFATLTGAFLGPDTSFCPGDSVEVGTSVSGSFAWSTGDTTATIWVKTAGTYFLTATSACGAGSDNVQVTARPLPTAGFTWSQVFFTSNFTSTSTDANSYWWDFGDGNQSTQQNPIHVYAYPGGTFTVTHVAYNECGNDTVTQTVQADETTGIDENQFQNNVSIFPNPNNGEFAVTIPLNQNQEATVEIINVAGATVYNETVVGKQGMNKVNIKSEFAKGAYFVRIKSNNNTAIKKLIIE